MKNYEYRTIKDGKLIVYNELEDHRRNKFVESWFSENLIILSTIRKVFRNKPQKYIFRLVKN